MIDKKKAEAIIKRTEAELNKNQKELETIDNDIRALQEKVYLKGQLTKTLKVFIFMFFNNAN